MNNQIRVMVTGVGGRSVGNQILHALKILEPKYQIIATDVDPFSYGLYETSHRYLVPMASDTEYIPSLLRIVKGEQVNVIMPGTEPETLKLSEQKNKFSTLGCTVICSPPEVVRICADKKCLHEWLEEQGFFTPKTVDSSLWPSLANEVGFPLIGKPTRDSGGSKNVAILQNEKEVVQFLSDIPPEKKVIFQEYVGAAEGEYTVGVLVSKSGQIIDSIVVHRKLMGLSMGVQREIHSRTYALSTGYSQGYIIKHKLIQKVCERLALKIGIRGPANIQCRLDGQRVVVFEVHSRFSGTTSIRAEAGFNEPDILIRNFLLGEEFNRLDYRHNVAAIRAFRSILVDEADYKNVPMA